MVRKPLNHGTCTVCGGDFPRRELVSGQILRESIRDMIRTTRPDWEPDGFVCREDVKQLRTRYVRGLLSSERGELTALEHQVIESLREHELLAANVVAESTEGWTGRSTPIPSSC